MDRQHRHDLKHDKFVDELGALSLRAKQNQKLLLGIAGGAIAIAVLIYGIFFYRSHREASAQQQLAVAIETFEAQVGEQAADQPALAAPRFKTDEERLAASEKLFTQIRSEYSGTNASDLSGLYLAQIAAFRNDAPKAKQLLEDFLKSHRDHLLVGTARFSLFQLRIETGEADKVISELNGELSKSEPVLPGDSILVLLAQAYEAQGDRTKSREAYRRITTEFPESPYVVEAQRRASQT